MDKILHLEGKSRLCRTVGSGKNRFIFVGFETKSTILIHCEMMSTNLLTDMFAMLIKSMLIITKLVAKKFIVDRYVPPARRL